MFLKALDVIDAARFVNERDVSSDLVEGFSGLEDGLEGLEGDGNNLGVGRIQDTTKGLDGTKLDEALDVLGSTASTNVGDDPRGLLPDLPLVIVQGIDDGRNETSAVDDGTNLNVSAGGNVGKEPARLLADILAPMAEKLLHHTEDVGIDDRLGLSIATAHEVTKGTQAGCDKIGLIRAKKLNESVGDVGILAGLDALIISVTEVAERPSDVDHDFIGSRGVAEQRCQVGKSRRHHVQIRLGLSTAQVGQSPNDIAKQSRAGRLGDVEQNTLHGARLKNGIAKGWRIARDVAEAPGALLADVAIGRSKLSDEVGDGTGLRNGNGAVGIGRSNVGEGPCRLKLNLDVLAGEETDDMGQGAALDHVLAGRVALHGKETTKCTNAFEDGRIVDVAICRDAVVELGDVADGVDLAVSRRRGRGRRRPGGSGSVHGGTSSPGTDGAGAHGTSLHEAVLLLRLAKLDAGIVATTTAGIGGDANLEGLRTVYTIERIREESHGREIDVRKCT